MSKAEFGVSGWTSRKYMQDGEQDVLLALVNSVAARTMVEIGVNIGLTALAVLRHVPSMERYVGIDVNGDYSFEIPAQSVERPMEPGRLVRSDPRFELIIRNGAAVDLLPFSIDAMFIDGDHGRNAVRRDSKLSCKLVRRGGVVIWHDYLNPTVQVTGVLDELQKHGRDIRYIDGTWLAYEIR